MTAVAERKRPIRRVERLWLCACGYVNGDGTACQACEAPIPAPKRDDVPDSFTALRVLWEEVQAERLASWPPPAAHSWRPVPAVATVVCFTALFSAAFTVVGMAGCA
jgi:hypothetical protein